MQCIIAHLNNRGRCGQAVFPVSGGLHSETQAETCIAVLEILRIDAALQELAHADYLCGGSFWRVIDTVGLNDTGLSQAEATSTS